MNLNGFTLSKYQRTRGDEGEGFTGTLTYNKKPVCTYEDYATGATPRITYQQSEWGQAELLATVREINGALSIQYFDGDSLTDCTMTICTILEELRDMEKLYRGAKKKLLPGDTHMVMLLTGDAWCVVTPQTDVWQAGRISIHLMDQVANMEMARKKAAAIIQKDIASGEIKSCRGVLIYEVDAAAPFDLTTQSYISIFQDALCAI